MVRARLSPSDGRALDTPKLTRRAVCSLGVGLSASALLGFGDSPGLVAKLRGIRSTGAIRARRGWRWPFASVVLQPTPNVSRAPGTSALAAKHGKDMPAALEQRRDLTPEVVSMFVCQGVSIMPSFRKTEISDAELPTLGR